MLWPSTGYGTTPPTAPPSASPASRPTATGWCTCARHYAPSLGIFPALDPFEGDPSRPMSLNGYSGVEGKVVNWTDASGYFASLPYFGNSLDMASSLNNSLCLQTPVDLEPVIVFLGGSYSDANQYSSNPYRNPSCGPATISDPGPSPFGQTKKWLERLSSISDYVGDQWAAVGCRQEGYTVHTSYKPLPGVNLHGILVVRYMGSKRLQATIASAYTGVKFPDTVHGIPKRPVIVIGYSAGADSALFFAWDYRSTFNIVDVVALGPTFSGSHPNIVNHLEWGYDVVNVLRNILSSGTNINIVDDSGIRDDFPDFERYVEVLQDAYGERATLMHTKVLGNPVYGIIEHFDEDEQGDWYK